MITRLSKIARLPAHIREELNHRLHDGELSRTIVPWINELPETKKVTTDLYRGKPITHQNLSEWRHTGYQDWLLHQQRLAWNGRLAEEEAEVTQQNRCEDGYEAMGFQFLYDISQARKAMQQIKNPNQRWDRLETLTRDFCRLQNAFNWSRRVGLEFDKFQLAHPCESSPEPEEVRAVVSLPAAGGASSLPGRSLERRPVPAPATPKRSEGGSRASLETNANEIIEVITESEPATPKRQGASALQDAPRNLETVEPRASVLDCGSPLPLSEAIATTPEPKCHEAVVPENAPSNSSFNILPSVLPAECGTGVSPVSPCSHGRDARATNQIAAETRSQSLVGDDVRSLKHPEVPRATIQLEDSTEASAASSFYILPSAFPNSHPSAIASATAETPKLLTSTTPTPIAPLPPLAPPTPTRNIPGRTSPPPIRGRRFICIEG